jgi:hypothetical protein
VPLVLDGVALTRSVALPAVAPFQVSGERLRVLMVISRPRGAADVGYQMIARPLLRRLEAVRGDVVPASRVERSLLLVRVGRG